MFNKRVCLYFTWIFVLTLVVSAIVTLLYNLIVHGTSLIEWGTSFRLAIILGIVLTWVHFKDTRE